MDKKNLIIANYYLIIWQLISNFLHLRQYHASIILLLKFTKQDYFYFQLKFLINLQLPLNP